MGKELLLEIGTEEIPAAFLPKAIADMEHIMERELSESRIAHGTIHAMATPRRLFISVEDVEERQEDQLVEKVGPAKRAAFDERGTPTKAALGFARGQGMDIADLITVTTDKGEYLCARKTITGGDTADILTALLPRFISAIPFQKSMRWMNLDIRFARPIHWILALYGGAVVPFRVENIDSGSRSRGHRFMAPELFEVSGISDYREQLEKRYVIVDPEERRKRIIDEARREAGAVSGTVMEKKELLEEVMFLVEYPSTVRGSFEEEYLKLPAEVLTTAMMKHQKYFPVVDNDGNLMPYFITINNTQARDLSVVARGNEKVIRARLADARFFFEEDRKLPLEERLEYLRNVTFHSLLGTSYEKVMQFKELALTIAGMVKPSVSAGVERTALLCKADLESQMVYEFPELQGVMGREYALIQGEDPIVAQAIYEHYLPTAAGGELPGTDEGAIVSIADKVDTITGCFGVNLIPTGTADPYALRRQALGVMNIIIDRGYDLDLGDVIDRSLQILSKKLKRPPEDVKKDVLEFFRGRLENQLISQGRAYDVVDAVLVSGLSSPVRTLKKIEAVEEFKKHPDFEPLVIAFKRVVNILKNFEGGTVDPSDFAEEEERQLHEAFLSIWETAGAFIDADDYPSALSEIARFRKPVDAFFETVLVMAEDEKVRRNRLSLLEEISRLFYRIADFSRIVTEG
ncbi:MAG: glycine--tRNA ligase subunit beta [Deltaproteobacteria bacterium]|nr:glycine--tRNA ligase subunit beta [Deltaproteobacteria bacterium]